jgi:hypothetical protein
MLVLYFHVNHYSMLGWKLTALPSAPRIWIRVKQLACQPGGDQYTTILCGLRENFEFRFVVVGDCKMSALGLADGDSKSNSRVEVGAMMLKAACSARAVGVGHQTTWRRNSSLRA